MASVASRLIEEVTAHA